MLVNRGRLGAPSFRLDALLVVCCCCCRDIAKWSVEGRLHGVVAVRAAAQLASNCWVKDGKETLIQAPCLVWIYPVTAGDISNVATRGFAVSVSRLFHMPIANSTT